MQIPLKDCKIVLSNTVSIDLKYITFDGNAFKFSMHSLDTFIKFQQIHSAERTYIFTTEDSGKIYKWIGNITSLIPPTKSFVVKNISLLGTKSDQRKPRLKVKDKVSIFKMEFDQKVLDLSSQEIPTLSFDISETGVLLYTTYNFGDVANYDDHRVYLKFVGPILGELGVKTTKIKRFFQDGNFYYYGCQFEINGFEDMKQIHKIIQTLKYHTSN